MCLSPDSILFYVRHRALLGLRAREIHLCGGPEAIDVVTRLCQATGDDLEVKQLSLHAGGEGKGRESASGTDTTSL